MENQHNEHGSFHPLWLVKPGQVMRTVGHAVGQHGSGVSNVSVVSGLSLFVALPGPDDVATCAEAERNQPAAVQLCGGTGRDPGGCRRSVSR